MHEQIKCTSVHPCDHACRFTAAVCATSHMTACFSSFAEIPIHGPISIHAVYSESTEMGLHNKGAEVSTILGRKPEEAIMGPANAMNLRAHSTTSVPSISFRLGAT